MSLVLTRKQGQSIIINDTIEITVTDMQIRFGSESTGRVRLMIHAPNLQVDRREIWEERNGRPFPGAANRFNDKKGVK
jgi:sRNA-binding carbon storage regulator CsrA